LFTRVNGLLLTYSASCKPLPVGHHSELASQVFWEVVRSWLLQRMT
jgi:hypothetical protein